MSSSLQEFIINSGNTKFLKINESLLKTSSKYLNFIENNKKISFNEKNYLDLMYFLQEQQNLIKDLVFLINEEIESKKQNEIKVKKQGKERKRKKYEKIAIININENKEKNENESKSKKETKISSLLFPSLKERIYNSLDKQKQKEVKEGPQKYKDNSHSYLLKKSNSRNKVIELKIINNNINFERTETQNSTNIKKNKAYDKNKIKMQDPEMLNKFINIKPFPTATLTLETAETLEAKTNNNTICKTSRNDKKPKKIQVNKSMPILSASKKSASTLKDAFYILKRNFNINTVELYKKYKIINKKNNNEKIPRYESYRKIRESQNNFSFKYLDTLQNNKNLENMEEEKKIQKLKKIWSCSNLSTETSSPYFGKLGFGGLASDKIFGKKKYGSTLNLTEVGISRFNNKENNRLNISYDKIKYMKSRTETISTENPINRYVNKLLTTSKKIIDRYKKRKINYLI